MCGGEHAVMEKGPELEPALTVIIPFHLEKKVSEQLSWKLWKEKFEKLQSGFHKQVTNDALMAADARVCVLLLDVCAALCWIDWGTGSVPLVSTLVHHICQTGSLNNIFVLHVSLCYVDFSSRCYADDSCTSSDKSETFNPGSKNSAFTESLVGCEKPFSLIAGFEHRIDKLVQ